MASNRPPRTPSFPLARYDACATLDSHGWAQQLAKRVFLGYKLAEPDSHPELQTDFEDLLRAPLQSFPYIYTSQASSQASALPEYAREGVRQLRLGDLRRFIEACEADGVTDDGAVIDVWRERDAPWQSGPLLGMMGHIQVDLFAEDQSLQRQFATWLAGVRQTLRRPTFVYYRKSALKLQLAAWHQHRMLAYADLSLWAGYQRFKYTDEELLQLLFPNVDSVTSRKLDSTKKAFREAVSLDVVHALLASKPV